MITVVFGVSMVVLDSTVVNVAFPTLRREFNAGLDYYFTLAKEKRCALLFQITAAA
jgi:hypothetical protein